jgi:hypothetical protein
MPWRWRTPFTPKTSAPHEPPHRLVASTRLTLVIAIGLAVAVLSLVVWYLQ